MQHTTRLVVVIVGTLRSKLREVPEAIIGARHNDIRTGYSVEERRAVRAVAIGVGARDLGRGGLHVFDIVVDGLYLGFDRSRLKPGREVVGCGASSGVSGASHRDGVRDGGLEGRGLRS